MASAGPHSAPDEVTVRALTAARPRSGYAVGAAYMNTLKGSGKAATVLQLELGGMI